MADGEAIVGLLENVIDGDDERQQPCQDGKDLVGDDGIRAMRLPLGEGVDCRLQSRLASLNAEG